MEKRKNGFWTKLKNKIDEKLKSKSKCGCCSEDKSC